MIKVGTACIRESAKRISPGLIRQDLLAMADEVDRLLLREKESATALAEAMMSADSAEARMEDLVREVDQMWKPLLAAAKFGLRAITAEYKQGQHPEQFQRGFMVGKPEYAVDVLREAIAACEEGE